MFSSQKDIQVTKHRQIARLTPANPASYGRTEPAISIPFFSPISLPQSIGLNRAPLNIITRTDFISFHFRPGIDRTETA